MIVVVFIFVKINGFIYLGVFLLYGGKFNGYVNKFEFDDVIVLRERL